MPIAKNPGGRKGRGAGYLWLQQHVNFNGEECLIWPLTKDGQGRGAVGVNGKLLRAHRVMCELVHGPAPTPEHHAAHSCGNGHLACVHPKHVSWKTKEENARDRVRDGRNTGNRRGCTTGFTPEQFRELHSGLVSRTPVKDLAEKFKVARSVINYWDRKLRAGKFDPEHPPRMAKGYVLQSPGKWRARLHIGGGKIRDLGVFDSPQKANAAFLDAKRLFSAKNGGRDGHRRNWLRRSD